MEEIINEFFDSICALTEANQLTGYWDNKRFQLCKKDYTLFTEEDKHLLYQTEKKSRYWVEQRAVHRKIIDKCYKQLVENNYK